jgi:hypothetical protein
MVPIDGGRSGGIQAAAFHVIRCLTISRKTFQKFEKDPRDV